MLKNFRLTRTTIVNSSLGLIVLSIVLFVLAGRYEDWELLLQSVGSAAFSVAAVSLVSELVIRDAFITELLEFVGLEENVRSEGLRSISTSALLALTPVLGTAARVRVLLRDPSHFLSNDMQVLLRTAQQRPIWLTVYVGSPDGDSITTLAARLGVDDEDLRRGITAGASALERRWRDAASAGRLHADSLFEIYMLDPPPNHDMAQADDSCWLLVPPMLSGATPRDGLLVGLSAAAKNSSSSRWIQERWLDIEQQAGVPVYSASGSPPETGGAPGDGALDSEKQLTVDLREEHKVGEDGP